MSAPLVCTLDNAMDLALLCFAAGAVVGFFTLGIIVLISKWNSI